MLNFTQLVQALDMLSGRRPIFHSEADFQHELAVEIRRHFPVEVRLEVPRSIIVNGAKVPAEIDLLVGQPGCWTAIELKYCKLAVQITDRGEQFALANSWGTNLSRFDCLADLRRVESIVAAGYAKTGYTVFLTNAADAWLTDVGAKRIMAKMFSIHEGRAIPANCPLDWNPANPRATSVTEKRLAPYAPIVLGQPRTVGWRDYSDFKRPNGRFRYLLLSVKDGAE